MRRDTELSERQRALFEALLKSSGATASAETESIVPYRGSAPVRLTYQQEGMWFLEQMTPGTAVNNVPCCLRIRGYLDESAFENTLKMLVERHESLRTCFRSENGIPVLGVLPPESFHLARFNYSSLPLDEALGQAIYLVEEDCKKPLNLEHGPVFRALLINLSPNDHVLIAMMHHLVTDGWSMGIILRELKETYTALSNGEPASLPELRLKFRDYAAWSRTWLAGENLHNLVTFWRQRLRGASDLQLPVDRQRKPSSSHVGAHVPIALSAQMTHQVEDFSRQAGVTRFVTLLAAFRAMLFSYSGQTDQVVGSPLACRNRQELEQIVGYFVNVLPFRCDLAGDPTFAELVEREKTAAEDVYDHSDLPFSKLVQELNISRRDGANPVYQAQFTLMEPRHSPDILGYGLNVAPDERHRLGEAILSALPIDNAVTKFDLVFLLWYRADGIAGACEYDTDLFDRKTIDAMILRFTEIVDLVSKDPGTHLSGIVSRYSLTKDSKMETHSPTKAGETPMGPRKRARKSLQSSSQDWVETAPLFPDRAIPLVIKPKLSDVDLAEWATLEKSYVDELLLQHRALLFRDFKDVDVKMFERFVNATSDGQLLEYKDRTTPRETKGNRVYTSTVHPSNERINPHNEGTYWIRWPLKLYFCCQVAAEDGGETPISDVRQVYARLDPAVIEKFSERQMMLVRNFNDGFGLPWEEVFQTSERADVEEYCRANDIEFEWKAGNRLRTRQIRPAIRRHPVTGEPVWFNHAAFFHHTTLAPELRKSLLDELGLEGMPYATMYGDGSAIEPDVVEQIRRAYADESVMFRWKKGDVMLLDNMSVSHAREPYKGPRDIVVCMTNVYQGEKQAASA